ncbi:shikimate kinase, chloroplastic-like [Andrographis paniculata]|uniref:shikimate kinase, chloroplastic-like n=1 Tax=Andrographis paniculata TaxID=175694 RepID=UPI0021E980C5|nr:shikimate kinase, chloroplastic-like [Andrographis paniculata]XP_051141493.1 shikimate kinase, chloroplastic-like [Andrographis paniculata]XP_051141494.1 shikimate kinase, chloroplastic-like [Andrographis paniculata]XP_051141495.1 shikimate kinase, chloroplastic-like [Andrographis paniculata]XP_051141497.1 shikimate kinase, chloroplastic-like [Andrographis paniculata]
MEAKVLQGLHLSTWMNPEIISRKSRDSLPFWWNKVDRSSCRMSSFRYLSQRGRFHEPLALKVLCTSENNPASVLEVGKISESVDESKIMKKKSEEIQRFLNGRCIYLVGMMGSGKTTVGKVLAEALGYSFYDCDALIEEAVGGYSVAEIFKSYGENFFRDNETEVLYKLSSMHRLIVSTGGGAVVRPINWRHMGNGITVWLDVPLEALARRLTASGTKSRPLLHHESSDPYGKTMKLLSDLFEERGEAYANATVRVSFEDITAKLGYEDACDLTPTVIAIEVLGQIKSFLLQQQG